MKIELRLEAAMCIWEAVLEENLFEERRQKVGAVQLRHDLMPLIDALDQGWKLCDQDKMCPFDWEFTPWFLKNCVSETHATLYPNWKELCQT